MKRRTRLSALAATIAVLATTPAVVGLQGADADPKPKLADPGYDILFVRHANSTYPVPEEELSPLGIQQAAKLVTFLHNEPIESVDSSIMVRTYQTADGVAADHDVPVLADEDLREVELVSKDERVAGGILASWVLDPSTRSNSFGGAENYDDVKERWDRWWTQYAREHRNDRGTGVVVAHGGIYGLMLPETCANKPQLPFSERFPGNTEMIKAHLNPNGTLVCTAFGVSPDPASMPNRDGSPHYYYEVDPVTGAATQVTSPLS
jgi:broad specificity phosphatase PhoE